MQHRLCMMKTRVCWWILYCGYMMDPVLWLYDGSCTVVIWWIMYCGYMMDHVLWLYDGSCTVVIWWILYCGYMMDPVLWLYDGSCTVVIGASKCWRFVWSWGVIGRSRRRLARLFQLRSVCLSAVRGNIFCTASLGHNTRQFWRQVNLLPALIMDLNLLCVSKNLGHAHYAS